MKLFSLLDKIIANHLLMPYWSLYGASLLTKKSIFLHCKMIYLLSLLKLPSNSETVAVALVLLGGIVNHVICIIFSEMM